MKIIMLGAPGAGKGTQAKMLADKYAIPHISTGDILREIAKEDSEIGNYVAETMASGKLVKDEITYQLIEDRLSREDCKNGFIIDGFPRNLDQAVEYDKILAKLGYEVGNVFLLNISTKTLEKRITGRRVCEDCNAIYNINDTAKAPQVESVCDKCGGKLYQRKDDNLESFKNRYAMYQEKTEPIIEHYRKQNVLHEINSNREFDEVFRQIDEIISKN